MCKQHCTVVQYASSTVLLYSVYNQHCNVVQCASSTVVLYSVQAALYCHTVCKQPHTGQTYESAALTERKRATGQPSARVVLVELSSGCCNCGGEHLVRLQVWWWNCSVGGKHLVRLEVWWWNSSVGGKHHVRLVKVTFESLHVFTHVQILNRSGLVSRRRICKCVHLSSRVTSFRPI